MSRARWWLGVLALVCGAQLATHSGAANGFLVSSQPVHGGEEQSPAEGYVSWIGDTPVLLDAESIFNLSSLFLGGRGPAGTGILDRRAAYSYLASLVLPWTAPYAAYLLMNWAAWWAAAAACYWLVRHRWGSDGFAMLASLLIAIGNGFVFMAGTPMSYALSYACLMLMLALSEQVRAFAPGVRLGPWLLLGWGAGVVSTIYSSHFVLLLHWWLHGLRRVPWRYLAGASAITVAVSIAWEFVGTHLVGLEFVTDNSSFVGGSVARWLDALTQPWPGWVTALRAATIRGTLLGAFPYPWWVLAAIGFCASSADDRRWALALALAGLIPAVAVLSNLPMPRIAYYMYPAITILAARGVMLLGSVTAAVIRPLDSRAALVAHGAVLALCVLTLAAVTNADLFGNQAFNSAFHRSLGFGW